jgi:hypothetical protein
MFSYIKYLLISNAFFLYLSISLFLRPTLSFLITYGAYGSLVWSNFIFIERRYEADCMRGNTSILFGRCPIQAWLPSNLAEIFLSEWIHIRHLTI